MNEVKKNTCKKNMFSVPYLKLNVFCCRFLKFFFFLRKVLRKKTLNNVKQSAQQPSCIVDQVVHLNQRSPKITYKIYKSINITLKRYLKSLREILLIFFKLIIKKLVYLRLSGGTTCIYH